MRTLRFREALREAMIEEMERDDRVFLMGEEVGHYQGAYKVSEGMLEKFGAKRVIDTPIGEENPVLVMESETLYSVKGEIPDGLDVIPLGQAQIIRPGTDVTIVAYSRTSHVALDAAALLEKDGVHAEVVDLRSLRPLDEDTIVHSVRKTHRCVVVHEGWPYGGVGAEICDRVQRLAFDWLDAPILRVTTLDVGMPYNAKLEQMCMPQ